MHWVNSVASRETQVANVLPAATTVLALPPRPPQFTPDRTLTLFGWGFTQGAAVALSQNNGAGRKALSGYDTKVESPNQITITGLELALPTTGPGTRAATINDPINGTTGGRATIGNALPTKRPAPTITARTERLSVGTKIDLDADSLATDAQTLVLSGANFGTTVGSNTVTLSTFAGPIAGIGRRRSSNGWANRLGQPEGTSATEKPLFNRAQKWDNQTAIRRARCAIAAARCL